MCPWKVILLLVTFKLSRKNIYEYFLFRTYVRKPNQPRLFGLPIFIVRAEIPIVHLKVVKKIVFWDQRILNVLNLLIFVLLI